MQSSTVKCNMFPIWAISIYILFGCTDSITAYSLDDNDQYKRLNYQLTLDIAYLMMIFTSIPDKPVTLVYLPSIGLLKFMHRLLAFKLATKSWNLNKMVADYMYREHMKSGSSYDPVSLKGYHYLVDWPLHKSKIEAQTSYAVLLPADAAQVIDLERIWFCNGGESLTPELKDACLSFSLSILLRRRFFGFVCGESSQQKTHDFVFKGLLARNEDGTIDCNRVFKVIDVELAFIYDFFFTKYAVLYYGSKASTFWSLAGSILLLITAFKAPKPKFTKVDVDVIVNSRIMDATTVIMVLLLVSSALLELLQVLLYWTTIWGRVSFVCQYIREQTVNKRGSYCMMFKEMLTKIGVSASNKCYYWDKLGQYSMIESVSYDPCPSLAGVDVPVSRKYGRFFNLLDMSVFKHNMHKYAKGVRNRRPGKPIKVPKEVKEALLQSLERTDGKLTNGKSSLVYNGAHHLLWACGDDVHSVLGTRCSQLETENQVHVILIWHIATCYCEMATLKHMSPRVGGQLKFNFEVATKLSKYCAYLLVSAPKLLPGHHYDTSCMFDALAAEAATFLLEDKSEAMRRLPESSADMTIFPMGVKLGKQLEEMEEGGCWKALADFWAEMLLYVAPSENVKEHVKCLANGGEFVTHLWALLSHAGIMDREQKNVNDIENAGADQSCPGRELYVGALRFRHARSQPSTCAERRAALATHVTDQPATSGI